MAFEPHESAKCGRARLTRRSKRRFAPELRDSSVTASTRESKENSPAHQKEAQERKRNDDEGEGSTLSRHDTQHHPHRDGDDDDERSVIKGQPSVPTQRHQRPATTKTRRERPEGRGQSSERKRVMVRGSSNRDEEQHEQKVNEQGYSLHRMVRPHLKVVASLVAPRHAARRCAE